MSDEIKCSSRKDKHTQKLLNCPTSNSFGCASNEGVQTLQVKRGG